MFSFHSACWHANRCVTRLSQNVGILCAMVTDSGLRIHEQLKQHARPCPFTCLLKILIVISFAISLDIAVYFQGAMSFHEYSFCNVDCLPCDPGHHKQYKLPPEYTRAEVTS